VFIASEAAGWTTGANGIRGGGFREGGRVRARTLGSFEIMMTTF